jgi:hypothetical protein
MLATYGGIHARALVSSVGLAVNEEELTTSINARGRNHVVWATIKLLMIAGAVNARVR